MAELLSLWERRLLRETSQVRIADTDKWETLATVVDGQAKLESLPTPTAPKETVKSDPFDDELRRLAATNIIGAIKVYRDKTGCDLRTAKNYVDRLVASGSGDNGRPSEAKSLQAAMKSKSQPGAGCMIPVLVVLIVLIGFYINGQLNPPPPPPLSAEEQKYGKAPFVEGNLCWPVKAFLESRLKDPSSLEIISIHQPQSMTEKGIDGWGVYVRYRARNSFGGYVVEDGVALVRDNDVKLFLSRH